MIQESTGFIILSTTKVGDNALVVHTLSKEWGRRGFLVRSPKKAGLALFLPLNILEAQVVENPKSELWLMKNFSLASPLNGIRGNIHKSAISLFLAEVLFRSLKDGANEEGLFDWCCGQIFALDALENDFSNFHVLFLLNFASALGFRPSWESLAPFAGEHPEELRQLVSSAFSEALLLPLNGECRNALCEDILQYLSYHLDCPIQIRSLPVLRELYR